jgi:hypothetical protein
MRIKDFMPKNKAETLVDIIGLSTLVYMFVMGWIAI